VWSSLPHTGLICNESQQFFSGTIIILDFLTSSSCSAGDSSLTSETSLDEGFNVDVVELRAADIANAVKVTLAIVTINIIGASRGRRATTFHDLSWDFFGYKNIPLYVA